MRIFGIVLLLVSFLVLDSHGQTCIGVKFGLNTTSIDYGRNKRTIQGIPDTKEFKAFHFGLTTSIKLSQKFALDLDLFYIAKGNDRDILGDNSAVLENTLALPVLLKYNVISKFSILGGMEINHEFSYYRIDGTDWDKVPRYYITDTDAKFQFGYVFGVAYDFDKRWGLDFRYVRIIDDTKTFDSPVYNRTFMISVHHYFRETDYISSAISRI